MVSLLGRIQQIADFKLDSLEFNAMLGEYVGVNNTMNHDHKSARAYVRTIYDDGVAVVMGFIRYRETIYVFRNAFDAGYDSLIDHVFYREMLVSTVKAYEYSESNIAILVEDIKNGRLFGYSGTETSQA